MTRIKIPRADPIPPYSSDPPPHEALILCYYVCGGNKTDRPSERPQLAVGPESSHVQAGEVLRPLGRSGWGSV
jgi:hypothetical protein